MVRVGPRASIGFGYFPRSGAVFVFCVHLLLFCVLFLHSVESQASVEVVYQLDDVDTTKNDNPHITGVQSGSFGKMNFPTTGPLSIGTIFTVEITNGSNNTDINQFRIATASAVLPQVTALNSGVNLTQATSDSVWNDAPAGIGFGANLNNSVRVMQNTTKTFSFKISSGPGTLTYLDFISGIQPAKGTTDKDLDSFFSLKWVGSNQNLTGPNGEHIIADAIFSRVPGSTFIATNTPVDHFFNATDVTSGASGILETTVPIYGAITSKSISSEGIDNATLRLTKTESFTSVVPTANTVGIVMDLKGGMMQLLNEKIADTIAMGGTVDQVMALSLKIGAGPLNQLAYGTQWNYGYDGASNPDRLFAYLIPGVYGTSPIFTGTDYYFQLDFPDYSDTFGTANFSTVVADIHGSEGVFAMSPPPVPVPEIPFELFWPLFISLSAGSLWGRLRLFIFPRVSASILN